MPILTETTDRPACVPGSKDEPFLPSIKPEGVSPTGPGQHDPCREYKHHNGNKSSRKSTTANNNNNSSSYSNNNSHRSVFGNDPDNSSDKFSHGNKTNSHNFNNSNNNVNVFNDRNTFNNDSLSSRLGQYQSHYDSGPGTGHKTFFSAPASESSTPFKLPSIDRSKSNSVSSLVSDRHLAHRYRQTSIRGPSRDRRSRLCRSPSCPSNLGCYWNDDDEDDYYDNEDDETQESRTYNHHHHLHDGEMSSMITPDTARLPPGQIAGAFPETSGSLQLQKSDNKIPVSATSSSRPCFGLREDSCTATNSSIKLPSIFPSRGSHNSSFLTTASSTTGCGAGGTGDDVLTADSSAVTSRDSSPFAFKREPTFFTLAQGRRDSSGCHANNGASGHTLLPPDIASRAAIKLSLAASGLSPRQEMDAEYEPQDSFNSTLNSTRSNHNSSRQQHSNHLNQGLQQQQQPQQSSALLLPISSTSDAKYSAGGSSAHSQENGGKRKRQKNGWKTSAHGLGDPASDAVTERLLREKLGAIERRNNDNYSPTTETAHALEDEISSAEVDDLNLIERVKNETNERNSVNHGTRDRDSKMSVGGDSGNTKQSVYQNTPTRIQTEKKVAPVKA